ncbi:MAG: hypothetical protein V4645_20560, partial [Pseudomonadota bacterium]
MSNLFSAADSATVLIVKAWADGSKKVRAFMLATALFILALVLGIVIATYLGVSEKTIKISLSAVVLVLTLATFVFATYQALADEKKREQKIETVEERAREHPERPQFAWDLARTKLESYLDRNLSQVRSIYRLTLFVMVCGFAFVVYGLYVIVRRRPSLPDTGVAASI